MIVPRAIITTITFTIMIIIIIIGIGPCRSIRSIGTHYVYKYSFSGFVCFLGLFVSESLKDTDGWLVGWLVEQVGVNILPRTSRLD